MTWIHVLSLVLILVNIRGDSPEPQVARQFNCTVISNVCDCEEKLRDQYTISCPKRTAGVAELTIQLGQNAAVLKCASKTTDITKYFISIDGVRAAKLLTIDNCALPQNTSVINSLVAEKLKLINVTNVKTAIFNDVKLQQLQIQDTDLSGHLMNSTIALQKLILVNTNSTTLDGLQIPTTVIELESMQNEISTISSKTFENLTALESFQIQDSNIETLLNDTFRELKKLQKLTIGSDRLQNIEDAVFSTLSSVSFLKIINTKNGLSTLPENVFSGLVSLTHLEIRCGLVALNNTSLALNSNLATLILRENLLKNIPVGLFDNLPKLSVLDLSHNYLIALDDTVFKGSNQLRVIDVSFNKLTAWTDALLKHQTTLHTIRLANNEITKFIYDGSNYENRELNIFLNNNRLKFSQQVECPIKNAAKVSSILLDLADNRIDSLRSIRCLLDDANIRRLDLRQNFIKSISKEDFNVSNKQSLTLSLENNRIDFIGFWEDDDHKTAFDEHSGMDAMASRIEMEISDNPITCNDCPNERISRYLDSKMYYKIQFSIRNTTCRENIYCPFESVYNHSLECPEKCSCTVRKSDKDTHIKCMDAQLQKLPTLPLYGDEYVGDISLDVSRNHIKELIFDEPPSSYEKITTLNVEHNYISKITFQHFPKNITRLQLAQNEIVSVNDALIVFLNNRGGALNVSLGFNPWICKSESFDFGQMQSEAKFAIQDVEDMNCHKELDSNEDRWSGTRWFLICAFFVVITVGSCGYFVLRRKQMLPTIFYSRLERNENRELEESLL